MIRLFIIGIICLFCKLTLLAQTESYGLYFSSHEVIQDNRTSLNLTPNAPFKFSNRFSLEFDINFRKDDGYYGYIFRIIANENTNIDLVSNVVSDDSNIWLVYKDEILLSYKWSDLPSVNFNQWVKVKIDFDLKNERLTVFFNEKMKEVQSPDIGRLKNFLIHFGVCKVPGFYNTDVCPMSVKNISIYNQNNKLFRLWTLEKHSYDKTYDKIAHAEATVENANWIIDKYIKWRKLTEVSVENLYGISSDANHKGLFFIDNKAAYFLSYESLKIDTIPYKEGCPYQNELTHDIIYNKYTDELWSYDFTNPVISRFNLKTGRWSNNQAEMALSDYGHHNKFISPKDSSLVTILGYGHYRYKGMVNIYNTAKNRWEQIDCSSQIEPRYLSSAGNIDDHTVLVFGGYGSKSGRQELSPRSYYDLYSFNLYDYSFTPLWTLPTPNAPFVPSETLVADISNDSFYTLIFNNGYYDSYLRLARFGISKPEMLIVGDTIPFKFRDSETWSYLFLNEEKTDLIAVISHKNDIALYAIAYPPLTAEDVLQDIPVNNRMYILITALVSIAVLILLILVFIKQKKKQENVKNIISQEVVPPVERPSTTSFHLLGGFQVFNDAGEDMTSLFSPTIKQLFLFLLLNSTKDKKGVTSAKLDEVLWYDKTGNSARNNRNVNISKLRTILEDIGHTVITNKNSLWRIEFPENTYCDYMEVTDIIHKAKTNILAEDEIYLLLGLLQAGELAPDVQVEWIMPYKSDFVKNIIEVLNPLLDTTDTYLNSNIRYHVAEYLLSIDPLNEDAIFIKCSFLNKIGRKSLAKIAFDSYTDDYEKLMGTSYPHSFGDIIKTSK